MGPGRECMSTGGWVVVGYCSHWLSAAVQGWADARLCVDNGQQA